MAGDRSGDLLAYQVVGQQDATPLGPGVEDVQHVLAVGRTYRPLVLQVSGVRFEGLHGARGEAVAAGEDDALVLGQPPAGLADSVEADHGVRDGVEDQVAPGLLLVRADTQQDQRAHGRIRDVGVGERLERLVDRLAVDALVGIGVVLRLDGECPADRGNEEPAAEGDVRVPAQDVVLARRLRPLDVVRTGEHVVALAPGVQEARLAGRGEGPAQDADVLGLLTGLEDGQQLAVHTAQLQEPRALEVAVESAEFPYEARIVEQTGRRVLGKRVQVAVVQGEDLGHGPLRTRGRGSAVAEEQHVPDGDDIAGHHRHALGAQALGSREGELRRPELGDPRCVQDLGPPGQLAGLRRQPVPQHLVRPRVQPRSHLLQLPHVQDGVRLRSRHPLLGGSATLDRTPVAVSSWWRR